MTLDLFEVPVIYLWECPGISRLLEQLDGRTFPLSRSKKTFMKFCPPPITHENVERDRDDGKVKSPKAQRWEVRLSALHQIVPIFLLVQFIVVLVALIAATRMADPQLSLPTRKSSRRVMARPLPGLRP